MAEAQNCTPEVRLEDVRNAVTTFSTAPEVRLEVVPNVPMAFGSTRGGHQMLVRHLDTP